MQKIVPNTNSSLEIKHKIDIINNTYTSDEYLQTYQYSIKNYMIDSNTRGLLIFHSPGTGKSILAASLSEYYRKHDPKRKIVILLSKSLQANFEKNIKKYMKNNVEAENYEKSRDFINETVENKYKFVSLNASNMYKQMSTIQKSVTEIEYEKYLEKLNTNLDSTSNFLENSLLIIDEVHNLSSAIKNGSKNAVKLYNTIMKTRNIKLLFLSGTPIVNTPFELVPLFNMLKGFILYKKVKYTLFPENIESFYNLFIKSQNKDDEKLMSIKNKEVFQNRILNLVSYYGDFYFQNKTKENFPLEHPVIIEKVNMSPQQYIHYTEARDIENKENTNTFSKGSPSDVFSFKDDSSNSSSYRIRSRQASNYCIPDYALEYNTAKSSVVKSINKITKSDLANLDRFSPKFKKIIENVHARPNQLSVVFSEFVNGEGINLFASILESVENYVYWRDAKNNIDNDEDADEFDVSIMNTNISNTKYNKDNKENNSLQRKKVSNPRTYAVISGNVPHNERESIIKTFNSKQNSTGKFISLLLISKSGAEGLSLHNVRSIHVMEPFWNYARIEQIIARGARFYSHVDLPEKDRNIQPYIYISTYPTTFNEKNITERSTDEELLYLSLTGKKIRSQFELAMIESSIDCNSNYKILDPAVKEKLNCYLCMPNNLPLYSLDINKDLKVNNCKPFVETTVDVKRIKISESPITFYYTKNGNKIQVFEYNEDVGGYVEMAKNNKLYSSIIIKLLKL